MPSGLHAACLLCLIRQGTDKYLMHACAMQTAAGRCMAKCTKECSGQFGYVAWPDTRSSPCSGWLSNNPELWAHLAACAKDAASSRIEIASMLQMQGSILLRMATSGLSCLGPLEALPAQMLSCLIHAGWTNQLGGCDL